MIIYDILIVSFLLGVMLLSYYKLYKLSYTNDRSFLILSMLCSQEMIEYGVQLATLKVVGEIKTYVQKYICQVLRRSPISFPRFHHEHFLNILKGNDEKKIYIL